MKKKIYVGCYSRNVKSTGWGSQTYDYLPITVFIERAHKEGLEVYKYQGTNLVGMWQCNHVYEITFKYKFRERKKFQEKLVNIETQPLITKWFRVQENLEW